MRLRIDFDIPDGEVDSFVHRAVMSGFKREEPRKAWTQAERKEATRWAIARIVHHINH
jgi:hypothetical protein